MSTPFTAATGPADALAVDQLASELSIAVIAAIAPIMKRCADDDAITPASLIAATCEAHLRGMAAAIGSAAPHPELRRYLLQQAGTRLTRVAHGR